jgi:hypothetical protein
VTAAGGPDNRADNPAYSEVGPEVLLRLGVDVRAPLDAVEPTLSEVFPRASTDGYFAALREAFTSGEATPGDEASQLAWVAQNLRLTAPTHSCTLPSWNDAWHSALQELSAPITPRELSVEARSILLAELLKRPRYRMRLADAVTAALRWELKR